MEKNGGSCAGEQRFHVFVADVSSGGARVGASADSGAAFAARRPRTAVARQKRPCLGLSAAKRKDVAACVDLWPAVIAGAGWLQLACVSREGGFLLDAKTQTEACDDPACHAQGGIPCVGLTGRVRGHHRLYLAVCPRWTS